MAVKPLRISVVSLALLIGPGMVALAQGTSKIETKDQAELVKPETSKVKPGKSVMTTTDQSKLVTPGKAAEFSRDGKKPVFTDQSKLKVPGKSQVSVSGGVSFSDQSTATTSQSGVSVTGGGFATSDTSEVKPAEQSQIRIEDDD